MPLINLVGLVHKDEPLAAVVYRDCSSRVWADICVKQADGKLVTVSNAPEGDQLDTRPGKKIIIDSKLGINELFDRVKQEWNGDAGVDIPLGEFAQWMEKEYAEDMDWRNSKGGYPTWEEFLRTAEGEGQDCELSDEQLKEAYFETVYSLGVLRLSNECFDKFQQETEMSVQDWEEKRDCCFALHEKLPNSHLIKFIEDHFASLGEEHINKLKGALSEDRSAKENFVAFNELLPESLRAKKVGEVTFPVCADIFETPFDEENYCCIPKAAENPRI